MERQDQQSGKKLINTLGWIVGKTLVITYRVLLAGFKIGLELIVKNLTHTPKVQRALPPARPSAETPLEPEPLS